MSVYLSAKHRFFLKKKLCKIPCSYELAIAVSSLRSSFAIMSLSYQYTQIESVTQDLRQFLCSFAIYLLLLQMPFCSFAAQSLVTIFCPSLPCFVHTSPNQKGRENILSSCGCCILTHNRANTTTPVRYYC